MDEIGQIFIRDAKQQDISIIIELIYLKAQFDGCPESVEATPKKLETDVFGENPLAFILLAEINGNVLGLLRITLSIQPS